MFGFKYRKMYQEVLGELCSKEIDAQKLAAKVVELNPVMVEDRIISYCRVFGSKVQLECPDGVEDAYLENAIVFDEPLVLKYCNPLLGVCYTPKFDVFGENAKRCLLKGRHLGLEGIMSLKYCAGDEADCLRWEEIGEDVLEVLEKKFKGMFSGL